MNFYEIFFFGIDRIYIEIKVCNEMKCMFDFQRILLEWMNFCERFWR